PSRVSNTGRVEPSPKPQTRRSAAVGISLRCLPRNLPSSPKKRTVQYSVPPSRSMTPTTRCTWCSPAILAMRSTSGPGTSTALSKYRRNCSRPSRVRLPTTAPKSSPFGYAETNASGNTASSAPCRVASESSAPIFSRVRARSNAAGAACTTAARTFILHLQPPPYSLQKRPAGRGSGEGMTRADLQPFAVGVLRAVRGNRSGAAKRRSKRPVQGDVETRAAAGGQNMPGPVTRRDLLAQLGVTAAATLGASAAGIGIAGVARAQEKPKGTIPDKPFRIGHMTFFTGPGAVLGEPMHKGNLLAADEINAQGGLLGKRKIEVLKADEAAGTDANVKEMRRLKLSEKIDMFMGITSSGNTPALGPAAEELKLLTLFVDGCTDFLFDKAVPNPRYIFRITNIQSADGSH